MARAISSPSFAQHWTEHSTSLVNYLYKYLLVPLRTVSQDCHVDFNVFFSPSHYEFSAGERATSGTENLLREGSELAVAEVGGGAACSATELAFCGGPRGLLPRTEFCLGLVFMTTV